MALTRRQQRLYRYRIDIWRRKPLAAGGHGFAAPDGWERIAEGVPCYIEFTDNIYGRTEVGTVKHDTMLTMDYVYTEIGVNLAPDDNIRTLTDGGLPAGDWQAVRGEPSPIPQHNEQWVRVISVKKPEEIP